MKPTVFCALALLLATPAIAADRPGPVVPVTGGAIQGRALPSGDGAVFKGIPFAAPPVGELRWREPMPVAAWQGVRDADAFGPSCVQEIRDWNRQEATGNQEDCLYLNVWTPEWPSRTKKPVMLWLHGGGNTGGGASVDYFDGASLARNGVVVVTINYRLGVFGFFAHPGLTAESPHRASGDYGLLDQVAALTWVRDNIERFGGDPGNVTLFGQSAGGGDTAYLIASPLSKGLFHKAIQHSSGGGARAFPTRSEAEQAGERFAASLQAPAGRAGVDFLRGLPATEVQKAAVAAPAGQGPTMGPSVDGWFMPVNPRQAFAEGAHHAIPLMIGTVAQEQRAPDPADLRKEVADMYGVNTQKALAYYGLDQPGEGRSDPLYGSAGFQFAADTDQRCGSIQQAIWHAAAKNTVYQYQFDRTIPGRARPQHSGELPYVFGNLLPGGFLGGPYGQTDRQISEAMQIYWTNFAKTSDPNGGGLPTWPKFDPAGRAFLEFTDDGPVANAALRKEICDLFSENLAVQMKTAGR